MVDADGKIFLDTNVLIYAYSKSPIALLAPSPISLLDFCGLL